MGMREAWRSMDIFLREDLDIAEAKLALRGQILKVANDAGEFVQQIHIGDGARHRGGWRRWRASYLPGPPGLFTGGRVMLTATNIGSCHGESASL
jgi:hypothetical protein